ncbi:GntR family transcriptional regulator [Mesorhizobium sp.]|uniref:GntR family transcriptional regulator n=2 Tax=Mesorhizobium sp. TaxID=1871066 RepID=UPI00122A1B9C|nr:GntR family transcriptional regulator [Mesorhizobium sp.]TIV61393.1 MAG: GntR family transcriptional regulator [Mesorhizobium sp.]TIV68344.1 MAG: GntR family transcriptional regulator [Mesorhizobium sp.]
MNRGQKPSEKRVIGVEVTEAIRNAIVSGEFLPGSRIRQETLASRYGSSRIPIREALKRLESEGLVVVVPNSGAWVAKIDIAEVEETYKIRQRLEPLAIFESVQHISPATVARLRTYLDRMEAEKDPEEFLRLDREFHLLTYEGARMPMLIGMVERFWNTTQHYRRVFLDAINARAEWITHYEHRLLLDAIEQKDAAGAERILAGHLRRSQIELTKRLTEGPPVEMGGALSNRSSIPRS